MTGGCEVTLSDVGKWITYIRNDIGITNKNEESKLCLNIIGCT